MAFRFAYMRSAAVPVLGAAALLSASMLAGCLGGDLDTSTVQPVSPEPITTAHSLYPPLKIGEKWDYAQFNGTDTGTTYSLEVVGESVFGSDSVYIERLSVTAPPFLSSQSGTLIENYLQTGLIYVRKSDQETVHDSLTRNMDFVAPGDSVGIHYREESASMTRITGLLPDSLQAGAAWRLTEVRFQSIKWFYPDTAGVDTGTDTRTRLYVVQPLSSVTTRAGTFPAYEIDETDTGSSSANRVWFSAKAKAMVREIDSSPDRADTAELYGLSIK